jgi:O-antigen ligase/polysaccharide polymerase Wzy-like membrane protein
MHLRRYLIGYAVFGPLMFLSAYDLTGINAFAQAGRVVTTLALLAVAEPFFAVLPRRAPSTCFTLTLLLFALWLLQPLTALLFADAPAALLSMREALYAAIWCSVLWIVFLAIRDREDLLFAIRLVDWLGIAIALSVYAAFAAQRFGIVLGDVQESEYGLRVFGPLGDMVTYVLLLFLFRELARGGWPRFAFYLPPFLVGGTRGALGALFAGLLAAAAFEGVRLARRRPLALGRGRLSAILLGAGVVLGSLFFSAPGQSLLERFDNIDSLGEDSSSAARWRTIELSWQLFAAHPVLGIGPGGYATHVENGGLTWSHQDSGDPDEPGQRLFSIEFNTAAQNQVSQLAAETGSVGLLMFALWCSVAMRTLHRASSSSDPQLGAFFAGAEIYAIAILIGTQWTCYLMDKSSMAYVLFLVIGLADRATVRAADACNAVDVGALVAPRPAPIERAPLRACGWQPKAANRWTLGRHGKARGGLVFVSCALPPRDGRLASRWGKRR